MAVQNQRESKSSSTTFHFKNKTKHAPQPPKLPANSNHLLSQHSSASTGTGTGTGTAIDTAPVTSTAPASAPASASLPPSSSSLGSNLINQQPQQQPQQQTPHQQTNGGPRVSFNRDVHVKRIAKHPDEITNFETNPTNPTNHQSQHSSYQQLPPDLSVESINKEAALVLAQAEKYKSRAENGDNIPTFRVKTKVSGPKKFHSLPNRRKKASGGKPVARSVSDASSKKPTQKRPSIFSLFSRKSDSNLAQSDREKSQEEGNSVGGIGSRIRLFRSKSDVSSSAKDSKKLKKVLKDSKANTTSGSTKNLPPPTQLSPIIENTQKEDYFAEQFNRERRKSEAITDREKHENALNDIFLPNENTNGTILLAKTPISKSIKEKILTLQAKSQENMHSSQLPVQKLPLTKGKTVNGLVKRLSMERFSPPPTITQPAFSYIRPNEGLDEQQPLKGSTLQRMRSPTREVRTPVREIRTPVRETRDYRSPDRLIRPTTVTTLPRQSLDRTDFVSSQNNFKTPIMNNFSSSIHIKDNNFSPVTGATTIRISSSHSPSPWQQLSPRNLSDEDEGLGVETRKYYDDDISNKTGSKSPAEPPIVPVIRSITPSRETNGYHNPLLHQSHEDLVDDLGYRRQRLESRILNKRFGDGAATLERNTAFLRASSPERYRLQRYLSAEPEITEHRYHRPETSEILKKYSPERTHLDIIAPPSAQLVNSLPKKTERTTRYKHTKYFDDGHGGVKEIYERESHLGEDGKPVVRESRHRERLDSYNNQTLRDYNSAERQLTNDYEPKSLDSQFTDQYRSSPEYMKRYEPTTERNLINHHHNEDHWQSSLKRDKLQQRSFDKGDSGIENDFRKESFNGDISSRYRKRSVLDDMKACEHFLKKERHHIEEQQEQIFEERQHYKSLRSSSYLNNSNHNGSSSNLNNRDTNYIYRERSIDDGSHYDPHLDKYPTATNTLKRHEKYPKSGQGQDSNNNNESSTATLKRSGKKLGGFEKVKQLFIGKDSNKKDVRHQHRANSTTSSSGGGGGGGGGGTHSTTTITTTTRSIKTLPKEHKDKHFMVKEEEMRSRYREHRANTSPLLHNEPKGVDISMRRRLSTPKASPLLLKRTSSDKTKKVSPLAKTEKLSWFKSLDRRAKSKEKLNVTVNGQSETSSMKRSSGKRSTPSTPAVKNLRFFGDTDIDSNPPTITKASTNPKSRPLLSSATLNRSQKYSQSAYNLDRISHDHNHSPQNFDYRHTLASQGKAAARHKSTSLHNLHKSSISGNGNGNNGSNGGNGGQDEVDFRSKRRHYSRSRDLDDISESGSETEENHKRPNGNAVMGHSRTLSRERLDRSHRYDDHTYRRSNDRQSSQTTANALHSNSSTPQRRSDIMGPPKPARSAERRLLSSYSRDRDRFPAESSGTEGESSLQSQRSVVYLHATTVGAIPQPYHLRRRSISKDDLRSNKSKNVPLQPMTRTVSRSVSMLAPWKPKLISEGYEINYSQEQNKNMSTTLPRHHHLNGNSSTLQRNGRKSETPSSRSTRHGHLKDEDSSLKNYSNGSATIIPPPRRKLK